MPAGAVRARCTATLHSLGCTDVSGASSLELEVEQHTCHSKPRCRSTTARKSLVTSLSAHTHVPRWRFLVNERHVDESRAAMRRNRGGGVNTVRFIAMASLNPDLAVPPGWDGMDVSSLLLESGLAV